MIVLFSHYIITQYVNMNARTDYKILEQQKKKNWKIVNIIMYEVFNICKSQ